MKKYRVHPTRWLISTQISTNKVLPERGADRSTSRARCGGGVVVFCANAKSETVAMSAMQEM